MDSVHRKEIGGKSTTIEAHNGGHYRSTESSLLADPDVNFLLKNTNQKEKRRKPEALGKAKL